MSDLDSFIDKFLGVENFNPSFSRLKQVVAKHELIPCEDVTIITVCGTNGKGETTRTIGHYLERPYAQFTSPHIQSITERFVFNDEKISETELLECLQEVQVTVKEQLSFYEFLFVAFLFLVKKKSPDFLLLEVGLGGRLDAVNVLDADIVALTSIGRDHQDFLGKRLDGILKEKLGVLRPKSKLVTNLSLSYLRTQVKKEATKLGVELFLLAAQKDFSASNQAIALKCLELLGISPSSKKYDFHGIQKITGKKGNYSCFGGHNPDGVRKLVHHLQDQNYTNFSKLLLGFSKRSEKDLEVMVQILKRAFPHSVLSIVYFDHPKAISKNQSESLAYKFSLEMFNSLEDFYYQHSDIDENTQILVCGSYYFMGELFRHIK